MLLSGIKVRNEMEDKIKEEVKELGEISFAIILIGNNVASQKYIQNKIKFAQKLNITANLINLEENVSQPEVEKLIEQLNNNNSINGIILQLPLPNHLDEFTLSQKIDLKKDIDGFNIKNIGLSYLGKDSLTSCTAAGIISILEFYKIPIKGEHICIAGRSNLVGKILALLLINQGATVTTCNSKTKNIQDHINQSDIFITAIGKPNYFTKKDIKNKDLTIIDVGINFIDGKMVGDVKFSELEHQVKNITPVPGGVGPVTVAKLMQNLIIAYKMQQTI